MPDESATFTELGGREHLVYVDEFGRPDECHEECPGCHWEGNAECEALSYGCDICDPGGLGCLVCGHSPMHHDPHDGCGACALAMRPFRHDYRIRG